MMKKDQSFAVRRVHGSLGAFQVCQFVGVFFLGLISTN